MATFAGAKKFSGLDPVTEKNINDSQSQVLKGIKQAGKSQSIIVEYTSNGNIKSIQRNLDLKNVLTMGAIAMIAGVTIHYVGPSNVIEYTEAALVAAAAAQKISVMFSDHTVGGRKEEKHTNLL